MDDSTLFRRYVTEFVRNRTTMIYICSDEASVEILFAIRQAIHPRKGGSYSVTLICVATLFLHALHLSWVTLFFRY